MGQDYRGDAYDPKLRWGKILATKTNIPLRQEKKKTELRRGEVFGIEGEEEQRVVICEGESG